MKQRIAILTCVLLSMSLFGQINIQAKLLSNAKDNLVDITAMVVNRDETFQEGLSYLLFALKQDEKGNLSQERKEGEFSISGNEYKTLSILKYSVNKSQAYKIYLFLRKDDQLISKDSITVISERSKPVHIDESQIEIKGLMIDNVVTKLGKDYYDYLYQNYLNSGISYPFIIEVTEKPNFGRTSKISITVDDQTVLEFNTQPNDEFLFETAKQTMRAIQSYSYKRKFIFRNKKI